MPWAVQQLRDVLSFHKAYMFTPINTSLSYTTHMTHWYNMYKELYPQEHKKPIFLNPEAN